MQQSSNERLAVHSKVSKYACHSYRMNYIWFSGATQLSFVSLFRHFISMSDIFKLAVAVYLLYLFIKLLKAITEAITFIFKTAIFSDSILFGNTIHFFIP